MLDFHIALQTLDYLDQEVDFVPWKAAFRELDYLCRSLHLTPAYGNFKVGTRLNVEPQDRYMYLCYDIKYD